MAWSVPAAISLEPHPNLVGAARSLFVIVDGHRRLVAHRSYRIARDDVAAYFATASLADVGFAIDVAARGGTRQRRFTWVLSVFHGRAIVVAQ